MQPGVVHLVGCSKTTGDVAGGSGLLLGRHHVLTAAHVLTDMEINSELALPSIWTEATDDGKPPQLQVADVRTHDCFDIGVVEIAELRSDLPRFTPGLAYREPQWGDSVTVLGYPPIPMVQTAALTVQTGEVVNPSVRSYDNIEWLLFSATARPGNSGGPIVANDGRLVGLVSRGLETGHPK